MTGIQAMRAVVDVAREMSKDFEVHGRTYFHRKQALADALVELDRVDAEARDRHERMLAAQGMDCVVCGRRFLRAVNGACCSIGCAFGD